MVLRMPRIEELEVMDAQGALSDTFRSGDWFVLSYFPFIMLLSFFPKSVFVVAHGKKVGIKGTGDDYWKMEITSIHHGPNDVNWVVGKWFWSKWDLQKYLPATRRRYVKILLITPFQFITWLAGTSMV